MPGRPAGNSSFLFLCSVFSAGVSSGLLFVSFALFVVTFQIAQNPQTSHTPAPKNF
jgi:hypothetical protein